MPEIKDFSKVRKQLTFRIDDDVFEAAPVIPAEVLIHLVEQFTVADPTKMSIAEQIKVFREVLEIVLLPVSMKRMQERMSSPSEPVDLEQLNEIIVWLMEEYGMRPTEESASSSTGVSPPEPGSSSTDSTPQLASISAASPSTGS
jgi:hypothetical protein